MSIYLFLLKIRHMTVRKQPKEYVIYVRKSTEDNTWERQAQSIPDQIKVCMQYAEVHKDEIIIRKKPENFEFETEEELRIEDNDKELENRKIYQSTRQYYIIKERKSAKIPGNRDKWTRLIQLVKEWKIDGILSYSPDRHARNMMEWGELIDCVDNNLVDLKYTNFNFEPNWSGKMMLWIYFAISKQYSDNISENVNRWKKSWVSKWISQWEYKYWYFRDPKTGHFVAHEKYFPLMQEAFRMKVEDRASDEVIAAWLNAHWYYRETIKWNKKKPVSAKLLWDVRVDEFYYWVYIVWKNTQDLREIPWYNFIPMISKERHDILYERRLANDKHVDIKITGGRRDEYAYSIPDKMLKTRDGYILTWYILKKWSLKKKLEKLRQDNPELELKDIIESKNVRYEVKHNEAKDKSPYTKDKNWKYLSINQDILEKAIYEKLSSIVIPKKAYDEYVSFAKNRIWSIYEESIRKQQSINLRLWELKKQKQEFIKSCLWKQFKNEEEEELYQQTKKSFDDKEKILLDEYNNLSKSDRKKELEFEAIINLMQNVGEEYRKRWKVRRKKICELLISNIFIDKEKGLTIEVKPWLECIFDTKFRQSRACKNRTHDAELWRLPLYLWAKALFSVLSKR